MCGKFLITISDIMQRILCGIEKWCLDRGLSVNPSKTEMILFTKRYKVDGLKKIKFFKKTLELCSCVKYLGVFLDTKLSWKQQVEDKYRKALVAFSQMHRAVGQCWV